MAAPSRVRYNVLAFAFAAAFITYLDRVCISAAAPVMMKDLGLTPTEMGYVFSIFAVSYAIFDLPVGWLGDRYGQRSLLTRIVACWSVFTILTGMVRSLGTLLAVRFVFGAAEAGAFPTMVRALARWFPVSERGLTTGWMWTGARLGGSLAPPLAAWFVVTIGWRESFWAFGAVGLIWCALFWPWYRDEPADHPKVNEAELAYIRAGREAAPGHAERIPWARLFTSRNLWALFGMYFCSAFGFFFFLTWLPTYLMNEYGLTLERSGWYSALPLAAGAVTSLFGGGLSDFLVRKFNSPRWGRRVVGIAGFGLAATGFGAAAFAGDPLTAVLCLAFAEGSHDLSLPVSWAVCVEIGRRYGGTATAFMNTASSISAALSPIAAAWLSQRFGSFSALFIAAAGVYAIGAALWFVIDPEDNLER